MAIFGQDSPDPRIAAGGAALGDMLAGGPAQRAQKGYFDEFKKSADAAGSMWTASDKRSRAIARDAMTGDLLARARAGDKEAMAELGAAVMRTADSPNFDNMTKGLGNLATQQIDVERRKALDGGDVRTYNKLTDLNADREFQPTRVVGGVMMDNGAALGETVIPLPQTQATIDQREASIDRTRANIGNDAIRADAYVRRQDRPPAGHKGKAPLSSDEADAKMAYITAQGTEYAKAGKPDAWVQAWMRNEAVKAGIDMGPAANDAPVVHEKPAAPAMQGTGAARDPAVVKADFAKAQQALINGAPYEKVVERMVKAGYGNAASYLRRP